MRREALLILKTWKDKKNRSPLLLRGARQVGKTWLAREFGKYFSSYVEINLEAAPELHSVFKTLYGKPKDLIQQLSLLTGKRIQAPQTLLFLDEIQTCPEALLALRYFKEETPSLPVIAAGSLLEFAIQELSFPVGRIDFFHLFPVNFSEYMEAAGRQDLLNAIQKASPKTPLSAAVHSLLMEEANLYGLLGGMPEVVNHYLETKDLTAAQEIQQRLIGNFREDFYKYAKRAQIDLLRRLFEGIPRLMGQKFKYSQAVADARSRDVSAALNLLVDAGLAYKVRHSSAQGVPLASQAKETLFKVYFLDIGLTWRLLGLSLSQLILERKNLLAHRGSMAEQFVAQELLSATPYNDSPRLHYWHRENKSSQAEVDFLIEKEGRILPIEVKSGAGSKVRSLKIFLEEHKAYAEKGIKISSEPFGERDQVIHLPLYAVSNISRK